MKYDHDRILVLGVKREAIGIWQKDFPLLFDWLYENKERQEELASFLKQLQ